MTDAETIEDLRRQLADANARADEAERKRRGMQSSLDKARAAQAGGPGGEQAAPSTPPAPQNLHGDRSRSVQPGVNGERAGFGSGTSQAAESKTPPGDPWPGLAAAEVITRIRQRQVFEEARMRAKQDNPHVADDVLNADYDTVEELQRSAARSSAEQKARLAEVADTARRDALAALQRQGVRPGGTLSPAAESAADREPEGLTLAKFQRMPFSERMALPADEVRRLAEGS